MGWHSHAVSVVEFLQPLALEVTSWQYVLEHHQWYQHIFLVLLVLIRLCTLKGGFSSIRLRPSGYCLVCKVFWAIEDFARIPSRLKFYILTVYIWVSTPLQLTLAASSGSKNVCVYPHSTRRLSGLDGSKKKSQEFPVSFRPERGVPSSLDNWLPSWLAKSPGKHSGRLGGEGSGDDLFCLPHP